jgi:cytidylate kinase
MTRSISTIIDRQARRWEQRPPVSGPLRRSQQPVITISSAYGSMGATIGKMVAEQLELDRFDRELVDRIAESARVRQRIVASLDDRQQDLISEFIAGQFSQSAFTSSDYMRHLCRVMLTIGQHGRAVIIGRGAQLILQPARTLRVRTVAELEARIARIAEHQELTRDEARSEVLRRDAERQAFCRLHFNRDVMDPLCYDLVINTTYSGPEQAAGAIRHAFEARFPEQGRGRRPRADNP